MIKVIKYVEKCKVNRTFIVKNCDECKKEIEVLESEVKRGGGKVCSRVCYYLYLKRIIPKEEKSWAWKGNKVGKVALHNWVERQLGKPNKCEHCNSTNEKKYEWANKSQKYKRQLDDWIRLCPKCHAKYDYYIRIKKWKKAVEKLGWRTRGMIGYKKRADVDYFLDR